MNTHSGRSSITRVRYHARPLAASSIPCPRRPLRSWPTPRSFPSTPATPRARVPPGGCAARARCPASSTAATASRRTSPSTRGSCATRSPTPARSSTSASTAVRPSPVLVKDLQRHPVRGEIMHVDFLRVNMNETIHTTVVLELLGADDAPGVDRGRRALPGDARGQHRGAARRHPGLDHARRLRHADQRDAHALRGHRSGGHHAARRPRGDRHRHDHPADRSSRSRTRSRPRRRSWARTAKPPRARPRARPPRAATLPRPPRTSPEGLLLHTGRLADRRARQPRARLRRDAAQRRLQGRGGAGPALGSAQAEEEVRG